MASGVTRVEHQNLFGAQLWFIFFAIRTAATAANARDSNLQVSTPLHEPMSQLKQLQSGHTRVPIGYPTTSAPRATTLPIISCPGTRGYTVPRKSRYY